MIRKRFVFGFAAFAALALFCVFTLGLSASCTNYFHNFMEWPNQGGGGNAGGTPRAEPLIREMVSVPAAGDGFQYTNNPGDIMKLTKGFKMGKYEVTQEQFFEVMGYNHSSNSTNPEDASAEGWKKLPVENVSWYEAVAFCNKLSLREGKTPAYKVKVNNVPINWATLDCGASAWTASGTIGTGIGDVPAGTRADWDMAEMVSGADGYRLPTEMEREWAEMGANIGVSGVNTTGYTKAYAGKTGTPLNNNAGVDYYAWYSGNPNTGGRTHEVGRRLPNELGLYDMSGNVWEWCWNRFGGIDAIGNPGTYNIGGEQSDYEGHTSGANRVLRGGGRTVGVGNCAVAYRLSHDPGSRPGDGGFRVLLYP